jgi:hypothetical protein
LEAKEAGARGAALCAWMSSSGNFDVRPMNQEEPAQSYRCEQPDRRKRFMLWQRMEHDVLNRALPPHAVVEN